MQKSKESSYFKLIFNSAIISVVFSLILLSAFSFLLMRINISRENYKYILILISIIAGIVPGFLLAKKRKEKGLVNGFIGSIFPSLILLMSIVILSKNISIYEMIPSAMTLISGTVGGIAGVTIKIKKKNNINRRKK